MRAGYSLELGIASGPELSPQQAGSRQAGSAFFAVDTRFGPLFLAYRATRGSGGTLYLFLGPFW